MLGTIGMQLRKP